MNNPKQIKKTISLTIAPKGKNYLGISLTKDKFYILKTTKHY